MTQTLIETINDTEDDDFPIEPIIVNNWAKIPDSMVDVDFVKTVFEYSVTFNEDLAAVRVEDGWFIIDRKYNESLNNSAFYCDEIDLMILTFIHMAENGRTDDGIFASREFLAATVMASDDLRNIDKDGINDSKKAVMEQFGKKIKEIHEKLTIGETDNSLVAG